MLCCCVALLASMIALQPPTEPPSCTTRVRGTFKSKPLQPPPCADTTKPCTEGTLTGALAGTYTFTRTNKDAIQSGVTGAAASVGFYVGESVVTLKNGNAELRGTDAGALDSARGGLASLITWTGGTGAMQHATGQIQVRGQFSPQEQVFSGDYVGTLCK